MKNSLNSDHRTPFSYTKAALWAAFFIFCTAASLVCWLYLYTVTPAPVQSQRSVVVDIPSGSSVRQIKTILAEHDIINDDIRFLVLVKLMDATARLRAGELQLSTGKIPVTVIEELMQATSVQHAVTVPEGLRIEEIAAIFEGHSICDAAQFAQLCRDTQFIASLGFEDLTSLEGYLYPDTYHFSRGAMDPEQIIGMMTKQFQQVFTSLENGYDGDMSRKEIVTLASIVEKETGAAVERPRIAGVFHNRLKRGMKLQSDPTIIYGATDYHGDITYKHLREKTAYNTYVIPALPPGPICNPGRHALAAVMFPEKNDFLYFVSKNDGTHYFSKSLKEHNQAVNRYQRRSK